jgi:hypothetical protein
MQLTLNDEEARTLLDMLRAYLPSLRRQAAGTDLPARDLRHELAQRERLCERLIGELESRPTDMRDEQEGGGEAQFHH